MYVNYVDGGQTIAIVQRVHVVKIDSAPGDQSACYRPHPPSPSITPLTSHYHHDSYLGPTHYVLMSILAVYGMIPDICVTTSIVRRLQRRLPTEVGSYTGNHSVVVFDVAPVPKSRCLQTAAKPIVVVGRCECDNVGYSDVIAKNG